MFKHKDSNDKKKLKAIKKKLNSQKQKNITSKRKLTKQEKREMKRKRKEFKANKTKYEIEGGIGGDKDPRTKRDMRTTFIAIFAIVLFGFSSILCGFGFQSYANYKKNNTEEFGSTKTFTRSDAKVKFSEVWTDKNREVTIVKLGYPQISQEKLSNRGKAYKIYMKPKGEKPKVKVAYGILGVEGDGYLFIKGKLKDQPYHIGIENTLSLTTKSISQSSSSSKNIDEENGIESAISSINEDGSSDSAFSNDDDAKKAKKERDFIKFIINPYSDNTKIYKGSFLTASGDINYSKIISQTSTDSAIKSKEKEKEKHESNLKDLKISKKEYADRVKDEKKKSESKKKDKDKDVRDNKSKNESNLEKAEQSIKDEEKAIDSINSEIDKLKNSNFGKADFGDMQEKVTIY
ncbi:hypothetical protein J2K72_14230 [Staphylococcus aureus]|uniref:hypothetical protein n=1 Tax=Staphylococcus aureus TaxID=1280 RepID=UPI001C8EF871|nr:hypothetical protein [Staphylococcus aureus]MBY0808854.1 hypothetical protein [Staphylococcus aureus]MBZ5277948.1 hypothetical protein [Staphylococcus aureus]HCY6114522.1 hypothetical protein [Staphylococcus aureus]HDE0139960.1 hypothetical protein [Staphylococcus aureus]HDP2651863.1 hypothetical protein [Staphylococcus aureus]